MELLVGRSQISPASSRANEPYKLSPMSYFESNNEHAATEVIEDPQTLKILMVAIVSTSSKRNATFTAASNSINNITRKTPR